MLIVSNILSDFTFDFNFNFVAVCDFGPGSLYIRRSEKQKEEIRTRASTRQVGTALGTALGIAGKGSGEFSLQAIQC